MLKIYSHPTCIQHGVAEGHPERPERLTSLLKHLETTGISQDFPVSEATPVMSEDILRAHPSAYLGHLESMVPDQGVIPLDPDTWMSARSLDAAILASGAVCNGVDDLINGSANRVFCAVRPPGHHAESDAAMGFCLLNSVAIGAYRALEHPSINRVAILDFDVHHGNGTVEICKEDDRILLCSSFQHPFYPHRFYDNDWPNIVNTPLAAGTDGYEFRKALERDWIPALNEHRPDLILVSAGFDAHQLDPLANLNLDESDFAWVTELIVGFANDSANGRVLSVLEGGYDLAALNASVTSHIQALLT